jgi:AraC-like DNA-binding protein
LEIKMPRVKTRLPTFGPTQFGPQVQNTGYFQFGRPMESRYRLDRHHLILLERGRLAAQTIYGPVNAKAGDFLCFRPARKMLYRVSAGTALYQVAVQFAPPPRHLLTPELPEIGPLPMVVKTGASFNELRRLFEMICIELPQAGSVHHFRVQSAIYRILAEVVPLLTHSDAPKPRLDSWEHVRLRVTSVEGGDCTNRALAQELGVSVGHFLHVFKQRFGMTPGNCRMRARLGEAVRQLRESDESVKAIAYRLRFPGAKGLTRALKRHLGLTASELRREPTIQPGFPNKTSATGPYPTNRHLLPPGDTVDLLMKRADVHEREL